MLSQAIFVADEKDGFDCDAKIEKVEVGRAGDLIDDGVNILGLDAENLLFKTVKVLAKLVKFKLSHYTWINKTIIQNLIFKAASSNYINKFH